MEAGPGIESLKTVIEFSHSLSEWSVLLIAGCVAALVGTDSRRPKQRLVRFIYLLYIPGLSLLFLSNYFGVAAQRNCLALILLGNADTAGARSELNEHLASQLQYMQFGFLTLGLWFFSFLIWWVFDRRSGFETKE